MIGKWSHFLLELIGKGNVGKRGDSGPHSMAKHTGIRSRPGKSLMEDGSESMPIEGLREMLHFISVLAESIVNKLLFATNLEVNKS